MLTNEEKYLVRERIGDFCILFTDALLDGTKSDALMVMENFSSFVCGALEAAKRDGRLSALTTTTN